MSHVSAITAQQPAGTQRFCVEIPATIRCNLVAENEEEARGILRALYGHGDWCKIQTPAHAVGAAIRLEAHE